jgi:hypothetical protein
MFGLELMPRSRDGVVAEGTPNRAAVLGGAQALGLRVDAAVLDCLVSNLDIFFASWCGTPG